MTENLKEYTAQLKEKEKHCGEREIAKIKENDRTAASYFAGRASSYRDVVRRLEEMLK